MNTKFEVLYTALPTLIQNPTQSVLEQMLSAMATERYFNDLSNPTHKIYLMPYERVNKQYIINGIDGTIVEVYGYAMQAVMSVSDFETQFVPTQIQTKTIVISGDIDNPPVITEEQPITWQEFAKNVRYSNDNTKVAFSLLKNTDNNGNGIGLLGSELTLLNTTCQYISLYDNGEYQALMQTPEWHVEPPQI